jgi:glycosyltransferase involved in cell wall biosynthesis
MKSHQPLVSVVTPVYNGSRYIGELITSVLGQEYSRIEHIVIDDGSNDNGATVGVLMRYPHLRWWSRENRGAYATMNEGLLAAKGEIVTFINSDDVYEDLHVIEDIVSWWREHQAYDGVCGEYGCFDNCGNSVVRRIALLHWPRWLTYYLNTTPHCSLFVDRLKLVEERIVFDTCLPYCADADWSVQMYRKHFRIGFTKRIVCRFRIHENQRTNDDNGAHVLQDVETIRRRYNVSPLAGWLVQRFQNATIRCGACLEDIHGGEIRKAWRRLLRGTWKANVRD